VISQVEKQKMGVIFSKKDANYLFFLFCRGLIHQIHLVKHKKNRAVGLIYQAPTQR